MGEVSTNLQVNFQSFAADTPFELVVEDTGQEGNKPVQVEFDLFNFKFTVIHAWGLATSKGASTRIESEILEKMLVPGEKRIKVYCSNADALSVRIIVDNGEKVVEYSEYQWESSTTSSLGSHCCGSVKPDQYRLERKEIKRTAKVNTAYPLGRRYDPVVEALTWSGEVTKRLRYFYDSPQVEIMQKTVFRDRNGVVLPDPVYDPQRGTFSTRGEAIGALVVRYSPGYSLYRIMYDTGKEVASPELWGEMKLAWVFGDIKKAEVPPVRLIALSNKAAVTASFARSFFPEGFPRIEFSKDTEEDLWKDEWTETQGTRESTTERIDFTEDDPDPFVEIESFSKVELQDENGRRWIMRLLNSNPSSS
ncbi:MAG: hypothetical protein HQL85_19820 [Magnetococcales bacterium]|nr:hypothetical protein [Magnetococcales bacterium]